MNEESNPRPDFSFEVNGLSAIAVLAVLLFHFNVIGFSGEFLGLDVFFDFRLSDD
jgi:peptidoglycan/LPS O-acetylase OafA/YrhL